MHAEGFGRDEEVLVQSEPLGPLSKQVPKRSSLSVLVLGVPAKNRLQHSEQRIHLQISTETLWDGRTYALPLHIQHERSAGQLPDSEEDDIFAWTEPLWSSSNLRGRRGGYERFEVIGQQTLPISRYQARRRRS